MNDLKDFSARYGAPADGTASEAVLQKLCSFASGKRIADSLGAGTFDSGFFSIASVREDVATLGGWEAWLPRGALWFASSAFGMLYVAHPNGRLWLVNSQVGSVMQTAFPLDEAIARAAVESASDDLLMRPLFREWESPDHPLDPASLLWSDPPVIERGTWSVAALGPLASGDFLSASSALFEPLGPNPISIMAPGV